LRALPELIASNREWAERVSRSDPDFFGRLALQQSPRYLWIGCSDSRVPANEIVGLLPGELFVHRNIANVVVHSDLNCLAVIQFAVDLLHVEHIIVCGHYGCSGVSAAAENRRVGLSDGWLRHIVDVQDKHVESLAPVDGMPARIDRLCELNVIEQVAHVCRTTIVRDAWERGQSLAVHGWIYGLKDGLIRDLETTVAGPSEAGTAYHSAIATLRRRAEP
jgi:carbonic anhydrase